MNNKKGHTENKPKMINRVKKGQRREKLCYDELADYPYRWKTIRHRFCNIDLFGVFDVVVANDKEMRFIQVRTGYCPNKKREEIAAVKLPPCCKKELWLWFDREGWRKEIIP
jgi:hypothetical protein